MRKVPRTMSTQHPDNVTMPFFTEGTSFLEKTKLKRHIMYFHICDVRNKCGTVRGRKSMNLLSRSY